MTIRSLSFPDFLAKNRTSIRLYNCISRSIDENTLPFQTIGDYLDAGEHGVSQLLRIPNLGKGTLDELNILIATTMAAELAETDNNNINDGISDYSIHALTFPELLDRCHASVRLRNGITKGISTGLFPYGTVGEYIDDGYKAAALLLSLPNIGKGAAQELQSFLENQIEKQLDNGAREPIRHLSTRTLTFPVTTQVPGMERAYG